MKFEIIPFISVGILKFGTSYQEIREKLGNPDHSFRRTGLSPWPLDHFEQYLLFVNYNKQGLVEAFEFHDDANVFFEKRQLSTINIKTAAELPGFEMQNDSIVSAKFGIQLYFPDTNTKPCSVLVYSKDYWT